jgi:hypothetical protein
MHPAILNHAKILVIVGHDEYWTKQMWETVSEFVRRGGHVANFSGNVAFYYVNLVGDNLYTSKAMFSQKFRSNVFKRVKLRRTEMSCFRDTGFSHDPVINRQPEKLFGVSYLYAGVPVKTEIHNVDEVQKIGITPEQFEKSDEVTIINSSHPVFLGTNLQNNDTWGHSTCLLDIELDGVPLSEDNKIKEVSRSKFPKNLTVLATAHSYQCWKPDEDPSPGSYAKTGIFIECKPFDQGGTVISFGSIGYALSLEKGDKVANRVFLNTINYLLTQKEPASKMRKTP